MRDIRHFRLHTDPSGIVWVAIDREGDNANTLSSEVLDELGGLVDRWTEKPPRGVVLWSSKPSGFIAGADVREFRGLTGSGDALRLIQRGHRVFDRLEALRCPTVALIHGFCLGGGLELALACRYRIAVDDSATKLGLPEVRLGIHPGFGGTARLIGRIGDRAALDLMLTGRTVDARKAKRLGLVDHAVPERHARRGAEALILDPPERKTRGRRLWQLRQVRSLAAHYMRRQVARHARPHHYPAPYALLDLWVRHGGDLDAMREAEQSSCARLAATATARNLVRVFFLQEQMKALAPKDTAPIQRVHVIGAGVMGGDIAAWCALRGLAVSLQDTRPEAIARAVARAQKLFQKRLRVPRMVQAAMDRLFPDPGGTALARADLVIEAIIEKAEAKQGLFADIEPRMRPDALLATNTSSIPLETLSAGLRDPGRLVGLHFFNPVAKMQLVEIVRGAQTREDAMQRAIAFTRRIDRLPLPVKSAPGFLVNRVLMPYLLKAVELEGRGVAAGSLDAAATEFGMPMGPIELADTVGLDICLSVARELAQHFGTPVPARLEALVAAGKLGRKSGAGFYDWKGGKPNRPGDGAATDARLGEQLLDPLLREAQACLRDGIVENADLVDAGVIFGTGFAPFRGGPLHYLHDRDAGVPLPTLESGVTDTISAEEAGTLPGLFRIRVQRAPDAVAYREFDRGSGVWQAYSWREMAGLVARWQVALQREELATGDRVAIMAPNGVNWIAFDQAATGLGLVVVPLYAHDRAQNAVHILRHSGARFLYIGDEEQWKLLAPAREELPDVTRIVAGRLSGADVLDPRLRTLDRWLPAQADQPPVEVATSPDAMATLIYTSGTTGYPKGVMLSHRNLLSNAHAGLQRVHAFREDRFLSFLPLSHALERTAGYYVPMMAGSEVCFARSIKDLPEDLRSQRPTIIVTVPRIFERVVNRLHEETGAKGAWASALLEKAVTSGWKRFEHAQGRGPAPTTVERLAWPALDGVFGRKVRDGFGGRVRVCICGGAALPLPVARTLISLGVPIVQGYGLTEASPIISVNSLDRNDPSSVGLLLPGLEVKTSDEGELLVRGPAVMLGYWNDEDASRAALDGDGFLKTGDLARIEGERIWITGRRKEIIVLANGEKVPPAEMEAAIIGDPLFEQVMVVGEGRPFLAALAVVNSGPWESLLGGLGIQPDDDAASDEKALGAVLERIQKRCNGFPGYARIRRVAVLTSPWSLDEGLITATLKLRRRQILERHEDLVERLYAGH